MTLLKKIQVERNHM